MESTTAVLFQLAVESMSTTMRPAMSMVLLMKAIFMYTTAKLKEASLVTKKTELKLSRPCTR